MPAAHTRESNIYLRHYLPVTGSWAHTKQTLPVLSASWCSETQYLVREYSRVFHDGRQP